MNSLIKTIPLFVGRFQRTLIALSIALLILVITFLARELVWHILKPGYDHKAISDETLLSGQEKIRQEIIALEKKINSKRPGSYFLVINSSSNEFTLYKGGEMVKKDKCSTGSYILLKNGEQQQWMFKTPKGEFRIKSKTVSPVWKKPDWAFVEEGLSVPPANHYSRYEYGVLGNYALNLGHGYLIHGTLYKRFLGLPVTHGCIRLNDENLELLYQCLQNGSKVYIF